ncbi:dihydroorotase [Bacteroidetes bacterium UKL13-3]|jgi:dihydroorotase|nr:dihydroorotase [Bacteroidetes bacterium UKL13-3]HCP94287.1 dihydroorotase [Bacteroidota bacterium]
MSTILIRNAKLVNEGKIFHADVLIKNGIIEKIDTNGIAMLADRTIDATGLYLMPGVIDDQVHFREPGLTHKGEIYTEAKAAVAGGVTSYMEMPNTSPLAVTIDLLEQKYDRAAQCSLANYSFFMGTTNTNLDELLKVDERKVCGVKIFMGSSTGDMLVDNPVALEKIFSEVKTLIATHCEDDPMIKGNTKKFKQEFGEDMDATYHHLIRSREACYKSSSFAVDLANKHNTRLHILHISTAEELSLFRNDIPLSQKRITAEACVHHLWFSNEDYTSKGNFIKWNPAVKLPSDRDAIFKAVLDGRIDVIATDHAPHTIEEKEQTYSKAPSGGPLVQHSLNAMLEFYKRGNILLEMIVQKMCHNVAEMFEIDRRGFIREGFYADLVLVDLSKEYTVSKNNILYKCKWSPFEGQTFHSIITHTLVNGNIVFENGVFNESVTGKRLLFNR